MSEKASSCKSVGIRVSGSFLWKNYGALSHLGPQECHCSSNGQTRVLREARHDQTSVFIENILVVEWMGHCGVVEGAVGRPVSRSLKLCGDLAMMAALETLGVQVRGPRERAEGGTGGALG